MKTYSERTRPCSARNAVFAVLIAAVLVAAPTASANTLLEFNLDNVTLADGGKIEGHFTLDFSNGPVPIGYSVPIPDYNITISNSNTPTTPFTMQPIVPGSYSSFVYNGQYWADFNVPASGSWVQLQFQLPSSFSAPPNTTQNIVLSGSWLAYNVQSVDVSGGALTPVVSAPEPSSLLLIVIGLWGLSRRKRD